MKKTIAFLFLSLVTSSAMAASTDLLKNVLSSRSVALLRDVDKMEVVATYRCQACYDIMVLGTTKTGASGYVKVHTELIGSNLHVKYLEGSTN